MTEKEFRTKIIPLRRLMYGQALRMGIPPDDAADAVQDTQIRLWHRRDNVPRKETELKLYCMAALRNECLTRLRLKKDIKPLEEAGTESSEEILSVETNDFKRHLEIMIETLPSTQRQVIRLSAFGEYETAEIAETLGQTETNVRQLLSRGRKKLREMMDKLEQNEKKHESK